MTDRFEPDDSFVRLGQRTTGPIVDATSGPQLLPGPAGFGRLLDQGLDVLRDNFLLLSLSSAGLMLLSTVSLRAAYFAGPTDDEAAAQGLWMSLVMFALFSLLSSFLIGISTVLAVGSHQPAKRTGLAALRGARVIRCLFAALVAGGIVAVTGLLFFPIALYLAFRLTYASSAACYEGLGPFASLARSWRLTGGSQLFGTWFGLNAAVLFLGTIPLGLAGALSGSGIAESIGGVVGLDLGVVSLLLEPLSAYMIGVAAALIAAVMGRFQLDLLARRDGIDLRRRLLVCFPRELAT